MTASDILQDYFDSHTAVPKADPNHPDEPLLSRKEEGLPPLPLNEKQAAAVVERLEAGEKEDELLPLLLNRVEPGTSPAAKVKAAFLRRVAAGETALKSLTPEDAVAHLGFMKGGYNIPALISLLEDERMAPAAVKALSERVLIYNFFDDVVRLYKEGNPYAAELLHSWAKAEWYTARPPIPERIETVVFKIPDSIEASTDFLSHSKGGHTRTDIPKHGRRYFMTPEMRAELEALKAANPGRQVVLAADKIGTSSSRKSGMNNVEWNTGIENEDTRFVPNKKTRALIFAGRTLGPIFGKTAKDMGSVIVRMDVDGLNTGDRLSVALAEGKAYAPDGRVMGTFSEPDAADLEMLRAGGGTNFRMGKILTANASRVLGEKYPLPYAVPDEAPAAVKPMTAAQKIIARAAGLKFVVPGMTVYAAVDTVGSQDTTGPMTVQELQGSLAAMKLAVPLFMQSQCHNAALGFRTAAVVDANRRLADFVREMGGIALNMGDGIIHSWLNEMVVPGTIVVGGDSHTRTPTALSFPQGSGGVAEAAATGVTEIVVPESVLVLLKGDLRPGVTIRDLVNYLPCKAKKVFGGEGNIFEGRIIEFRREGAPLEMIDVFRLTNASAERSATAAYFEQNPQIVADYLKAWSIPLLKQLIAAGYDNGGVLEKRVAALQDWCASPSACRADDGASYSYVLSVDLDEIDQPYIACPHTPDNVKPLSELENVPAGFCFVGSCMSAYSDFTEFERVTRGTDTLAVETWMAPPTRITEARLKGEGIQDMLEKRGVRFEVSGCSLCMGNQERVSGERNVLTTSTRNFKGRIGDAASVYLVSSLLAATAARLGRFPTVSEYFEAVKNG